MPGCSGVHYDSGDLFAWDRGYDLDPEEHIACAICNVKCAPALDSLVPYRDILLYLDSG